MPDILDPYKVGYVAGPAAFSAKDYVVLVADGNIPARVLCRNNDPSQSIRIILRNDRDMYKALNYRAADLGYPLSKDLWSAHQKEWYQRCVKEPERLQEWANNAPYMWSKNAANKEEEQRAKEWRKARRNHYLQHYLLGGFFYLSFAGMAVAASYILWMLSLGIWPSWFFSSMLEEIPDPAEVPRIIVVFFRVFSLIALANVGSVCIVATAHFRSI